MPEIEIQVVPVEALGLSRNSQIDLGEWEVPPSQVVVKTQKASSNNVGKGFVHARYPRGGTVEKVTVRCLRLRLGQGHPAEASTLSSD